MQSFNKNLYGTDARTILSMLQSGQGSPKVSFVTDSVEGRDVVRMKVEWS